MLFQRRLLPYSEVRRDEVFDLGGRHERFIKTRRGSRVLHEDGDTVTFDPAVVVSLSYKSTLRRERLERTNEFIRRMTDNGMTYFSSVYTCLDEFTGVTYQLPALDAWDDTLLFGIDGRALLLVVRLNYVHSETGLSMLSGERLHWSATLVAKSLEYTDMCRQANHLGYPSRQIPLDNFGHQYKDEPLVPFFVEDRLPEHFTRYGSSGHMEGVRYVTQRTYGQSDSQVLAPHVAADSLLGTLDAMRSFVAIGSISELDVSWLPPRTFHNADAGFWPKLNSSYLCKIVRRPRGMPRFHLSTPTP